MARRQRTKAELEAEIKYLKKHGFGDNLSKILEALFKWAGLAAIAFFAYLAIEHLAGKETRADISVNAKATATYGNSSEPEKSDNAPEISGKEEENDSACSNTTHFLFVGLAIIFGVAGIVYGRRESKLRKDTVERLQDRNCRLEREIDPKRSSSQLTPRGDTRPEDI